MSQHDYNISNAGGAAVRSDINAALAAILSVNSGPTAPTTTAPFMPWYDTSTGKLKMRNAADTAWVDFVTVANDNTFTGTNQFNTPSVGDNSQKAATTAFVQAKDVLIATNVNVGPQSIGTGATNIGVGAAGTQVVNKGSFFQASGQVSAPAGVPGFVRARGVVRTANSSSATSPTIQLRVNGTLVGSAISVPVNGTQYFELGYAIGATQAAAISGKCASGSMDFSFDTLTYEFFPS